MFTITKGKDEDIQDGNYAQYDIFQLTIDNRIVFSTEDINTLEEIATDESAEGSWLLDADRNSQEQSELIQARITKANDNLKLDVQKKVNGDFEFAGEASVAEFVTAVNSL